MIVEIKYQLGAQKVIVNDVIEVFTEDEVDTERRIVIRTDKGYIVENLMDIKELKVLPW